MHAIEGSVNAYILALNLTHYLLSDDAHLQSSPAIDLHFGLIS
jgi:hypothetical protein